MSSLYDELASVYEAMYDTFIDYRAEFEFYNQILTSHGKTEVLEVGCGTGNLANHFIQSGKEYIGFDMSQAMIELGQAKAPTAQFLIGDMREFKLPKPVQSAIITARTISYLYTNSDVNSSFKSLYDNLNDNGILCFDIIDANRFVPMMASDELITHEASAAGVDYVRKSDWQLMQRIGMDYDWLSTYYKKTENGLVALGTDVAKVRTFTKDEIQIFLTLNGFKVLDIIDRPSYFFPTYVFVAQKVQ